MDPLRVMTFNVRYDDGREGEHGWDRRRDLVAGTIRYHDPDLVGLQEPLAHQLDYLAAALPAYEWVGESREAGDGEGEYAPVGVRRERFAVEDSGTFWLSESGDPGSLGWDATHPRVATWVRAADATGDGAVVHCNTHLDYDGDRARREGAGLVADRVRELADGETVVVTGDCNAVPGEPAYRRLDGAPLADGRELRPAADAATHRHGPTTTRTTFTDLDPDWRVDHVFVADDRAVESHAVVTDRDDGHYPSDHLPVVVDLSGE